MNSNGKKPARPVPLLRRSRAWKVARPSRAPARTGRPLPARPGFRGFGSRAGLLQALLEERSRELRDAITNGPPPLGLGPGAPVPERLLAFLNGLGAIAEGNAVLLSAHEQACAESTYDDPSYPSWHRHLSTLLAEARPDLDAGFRPTSCSPPSTAT
jgi:hypothetical protein